MAYDEKLAERVRGALAGRPDLSERKMFGGLAFMLGGHMACGVVKDELMLRVGPERYEEALALAHVRAMDFTGRPMKGMVYVGTAGLGTDADLRGWVERAAAYSGSLPPKPAR
jgi:TfoX/Sxy family transcriptional regulator of competence genes